MSDTYKGAYDDNSTYQYGNIIEHHDKIYYCLQSTVIGCPPPDLDIWKSMGICGNRGHIGNPGTASPELKSTWRNDWVYSLGQFVRHDNRSYQWGEREPGNVMPTPDRTEWWLVSVSTDSDWGLEGFKGCPPGERGVTGEPGFLKGETSPQFLSSNLNADSQTQTCPSVSTLNIYLVYAASSFATWDETDAVIAIAKNEAEAEFYARDESSGGRDRGGYTIDSSESLIVRCVGTAVTGMIAGRLMSAVQGSYRHD